MSDATNKQFDARSLVGRTAAITGSSSGIGRATALAMAACGADVLIHARRSCDAANEVAAAVRGMGRESTVLLADLAETAGQDQLVEAAWKWRGGVDVWMNNAGADVLTGEAANWSFEQKLQEILQVDVTSTLRLSRAIGARMVEQQSGSIINIGWDQAVQGMAGDSGEMFAASKGAIMAFSRSLARSLAPTVRVNCIAPGWIRTKWADEEASAAWQQRAIGESLLGRWGEPEDVAQLACFLGSRAAEFINGQVIAVNGGFKQA